MNGQYGLNRLVLNENRPIHEHIDAKANFYHGTSVPDGNRDFTLDAVTTLPKFLCETALVDRLQKPSTEFPMDVHARIHH